MADKHVIYKALLPSDWGKLRLPVLPVPEKAEAIRLGLEETPTHIFLFGDADRHFGAQMKRLDYPGLFPVQDRWTKDQTAAVTFILDKWRNEYASYRAREGASDPFKDPACRKGQCGDMTLAAIRFTDTLRASRELNDEAKMLLIHPWVNMAIAYDQLKQKNFDASWKPKEQWHQPSRETLETKRGQCADIALLKDRMADAAGVAKNARRVVAGEIFKPFGGPTEKEWAASFGSAGHALMVMNAGGRNYILNNYALKTINEKNGSVRRSNFDGLRVGAIPVEDFITDKNITHGFTPLLSGTGDKMGVYPFKLMQNDAGAPMVFAPPASSGATASVPAKDTGARTVFKTPAGNFSIPKVSSQLAEKLRGQLRHADDLSLPEGLPPPKKSFDPIGFLIELADKKKKQDAGGKPPPKKADKEHPPHDKKKQPLPVDKPPHERAQKKHPRKKPALTADIGR